MDFSEVKELENKFGLKASKQNLCFVRGKGSTLFDMSDKSYLDLTSGDGESCMGYGNPLVTEAVANQAQKLLYLSGAYYSESNGQLLNKLLTNTGFNKAFVTTGASEAKLTALDMIASYSKENSSARSRIVVSTGEQRQRIATGNHVFVEYNNFNALKKALTPETAALIIAPVTDSGIKIADYDYLVNAYALCKSMGIILACDETRIGIGRTGKRFAFESYGVQPDIVAISRGLAAGLPIGAVLTRDIIAGGYKPHKLRHNNVSLLSLAAAGVVLDRLESGMVEEICEMGDYLFSRLYKLTKYNFVIDVRGKGLLAGIELSGRIMAAKVVSQMEKLGYLLSYTEDNIIRLSPAFNITTAEIDEATDALGELFAATNI